MCIRDRFYSTAWSKLGATKVRTMWAGCITFWVFFEDCVKSDAQKCLVHHKSIIPDQYASASACVVSRKICFGFQFWLQSFFHATPNVQFARKWKNSEKSMKLRSETRFREQNWLGRLVVYIIWLVQTSNTILYSSQLGKSWSNKSSNYVRGLYHFLGVFRWLREIWRAEMLSASQINYFRSIRIRQCMRGVSEISFWPLILAPKFFPCHPKWLGELFRLPPARRVIPLHRKS